MYLRISELPYSFSDLILLHRQFNIVVQAISIYVCSWSDLVVSLQTSVVH